MLKVKNISKAFGGLRAVNSLSFTLNEGEILGLVGPNGSGKTTTFNLILGFYRPDEGDILFKGQSIFGLKPHQICQAGLARTFQLTKPFKDISVLENTKIGAFNRTNNPRQATLIAERELEFLGLFNYRDQLAKNITLPDQKCLEIARALSTEPEILFLDEPIAGLNESETLRMMETVEKINQRGITIIAIEHVMRVIMTLSKRIVVLNHGEKIAEGTPQDISRNQQVIDCYLGEESSFAGS